MAAIAAPNAAVGRAILALLVLIMGMIAAERACATPGLERALAAVARLPEAERSQALAVGLLPEGHWRLANAKGEVITASGKDELARALSVLIPGQDAKAGRRVALVLSDDAVAAAGPALAELPQGATLFICVGTDAVPLERHVIAGGERLLARAHGHLYVETGDPDALRDIFWHLARPFSSAGLRLVALEPGGPSETAPPSDRRAGPSEVEAIDPADLPRVLARLKGEIVVLSGRIEGDSLAYQPRRGERRTLPLEEIRRAALAADANVVVLETRSARQPGDRNWLFLARSFKGLERAMAGGEASAAGDFLAAFAASQGGFLVRLAGRSGMRLELMATPMRTAAVRPGEERRGLKSYWQSTVGAVTGDMVVERVLISAKSRARQSELDVRIVPGLPTWVQYGYLGSLALGFLGLPVARGWFDRLWPPEVRSEYRSHAGFRAARAVRLALFAVVFLPLVGLAALPAQLARAAVSGVRRALGRSRPDATRAARRGRAPAAG